MVELKLYQSVVCCLCVSRVFELAGGAAYDATSVTLMMGWNRYQV